MRLLELEIHNVRGIPSLILKPNGKNLVIWGPNGSGKSAVVDAIDFLLTGKVSRLTGKGTGGITLNKHGPHIDYSLEEATVRAIVKLPGVEKPVEIRRCMANYDKLESDPSALPYLNPIINLAHQGQHVLTRREILRYITSEPRTRAQEIQDLLNISEIEDIRKALVKVHNELENELQDIKHEVNIAREAVNETVDETTFLQHKVLEYINQNRGVLGGDPIGTTGSRDLKNELKPQAIVSIEHAINVDRLEQNIQKLRSITLPEIKKQISQNDEELRDVIRAIRSDPNLLRAISRLRLTQMGMKLIDETGECPLCDTSWPPGELLEYLERRILLAKEAEQHQQRITELSKVIIGFINSTTAGIQQVIRAAKVVNLEDEVQILQTWHIHLLDFSKSLSDAANDYQISIIGSDQVKKMFAPDNLDEVLDDIYCAAKEKYPEATPEQTAWDNLTHLEENLKALEKAQSRFDLAEINYKRAAKLNDSFQQARDKVLGRLYEEIRDRFVQFYRKLHGIDEERFTAIIEPEKAGLNLEVDFYGRGTHPPQALHSEGHQDSMGFCLYLALSERLTKGLIDLIILDDVMMSVDADHRRQACHLLAEFFPDKQFLITTHDKTWTNQLRSEGVVDSQGAIEFYNWNVDTGPKVNYEIDLWDLIEDDIQRNDISSASARLRRGAEQFFGMACDSLQAQVTYKMNGRWQLGDFLPAAISRYKSLLKQAKSAAQTWGDTDRSEMLQKLENEAQQIIERSKAEQWAINSSVHYNNWANLSEEDFRPVAEAFQYLCGLFLCSSCGGMLQLAMTEMTPVNVRCSCGKVNWNLTKKKASR